MDKYSMHCLACGLLLDVPVQRALLAYDRCPKCKSADVIDTRPQSECSPLPRLAANNAVQQLAGPKGRALRTDAASMHGTKYLYLADVGHAATWVNGGGPIPLRLASAHLGKERSGTKTPDETLVHRSPFDVRSLWPGIRVGGKNISLVGNVIEGASHPPAYAVDFYSEDGLVLCMSNELSHQIMQRLGHCCCVAVDDVQALKSTIDQQLGVESVAANCQYTDDHNRDHFLKGMEDSWMKEFRFYWPIFEIRGFELPAGLARHSTPAP